VTSLTTGVELIQRELLRVLEKFGVAPFTSVGQPFDPERHEAIARVQRPDLPDMSVAGETARGYLLHGRVLRPAMVTVAVAPDQQASDA
jgi:molecular chaperone GrpE